MVCGKGERWGGQAEGRGNAAWKGVFQRNGWGCAARARVFPWERVGVVRAKEAAATVRTGGGVRGGDGGPGERVEI